MTQKEWNKLLGLAQRLCPDWWQGGAEDFLQTAIMRELKKNGRITSYLPIRMKLQSFKDGHPRLPRHNYPLEVLDFHKDFPLDETDKTSPSLMVESIGKYMDKHPSLYTNNEVSVFVLRSVGLTHYEIADQLRLSRQRIDFIWGRVQEKLRIHLQGEGEDE